MNINIQNEVLDDKDDFLKAPVASLKEGLPIREFIANHETEFEIKPDDGGGEFEETTAESCFNFEDIEKLVNLDMLDVDVKDGEDGTPFDRYRRKMVDVRDDGKVKKYVVKRGVGPKVPSTAVVYLRYQAYMEYSEVPFDSTLWQCGGEADLPASINLSKGQLLPGLHEAILTMQKGEKAEILVHPDLAYGQLGCPPRIPPEATILFVVEVDRFIDCGDAFEEQDDLDMYERKAYQNVKKKARGDYMLGNDLFSKENYKAALQKYRLAINMMHNARLADDEEEEERNQFLIKNYTNACICYKKLKEYKRICIMAADAANVDEKKAMNNPKLRFYWGYAKMMLGDYSQAEKHLCKAVHLAPRATEISLALKELEKKKTDALNQERFMMRRAFGNIPPSTVTITEVEEDETQEQFRRVVKEDLKLFANDPQRDSMFIKDQEFPEHLEQIYLNEAKALGLYARVADSGKRIIHISKPDDY